VGITSQNVSVTGNVFRLATASPVTPSPVVLANQRVGGSLTQALTLTNTAAADGFSERLNATIVASGTATASGAFNLLGAGASSSALLVGVDTVTAGAKGGTATITLASDGTGTSGFSAVGITSQNVSVSGNVFRLATASAVAPSPVVLANQRVGGSLTQALTFTNTAAVDGFSESLNASIAANGTATASGSFSLLAAGASSSALLVGVDTVTAGAKGGTATITLASDGTGTSGFSALGITSQNVSVTGNVFRLATASAVAPSPVVLANQRVGGSLTQALTLTNTAAVDGFSESLNASIVASGTATASGSFSLLSAGASSSALLVGVDTVTAGAKGGTATITLASDGTGTSGFGALGITSQNVNVSGNVFRLASPQLNTPSVTLFARQGDAAPSSAIGITNVSPDAFTERLNATITSSTSGFAASGGVNGIVAGASSNALGVTLNTGTAGQFIGTSNLQFVSSGAGTTGAADANVGTAQVDLTGRVYTPAVLLVNTGTVNFGIVHKGDAVAARNVSITNAAPASALNDVLRGNLAGATGPFTAGGTVAGLAAQSSDSTSLTVALNTSASGQFAGNATVTAASHNPDMADLALAPVAVNFLAQVNNFAEVSLVKTAGDGLFSQAGGVFTLDFGTFVLGSAARQTDLSVFNSAVGFADLLRGSFVTSGVDSPFALTGFGNFDNLIAGAQFGGLSVSMAGAIVGNYENTIVLRSTGFNASGFSGDLADQTLVLRGSVAAVPEPGTYAMMFAGLMVIVFTVRRRSGRRVV
jgi:hypothetical protein